MKVAHQPESNKLMTENELDEDLLNNQDPPANLNQAADRQPNFARGAGSTVPKKARVHRSDTPICGSSDNGSSYSDSKSNNDAR